MNIGSQGIVQKIAANSYRWHWYQEGGRQTKMDMKGMEVKRKKKKEIVIPLPLERQP